MTQVTVGGVGTFDIMFDTFAESYTNSFTNIQVAKTTQQARERWDGGVIDTFTLELTIVAGTTQGSGAPQTGADIIKICEKAMGVAVQREGGQFSGGVTTIPTVDVSIGSWYKRKCIVHRCDCSFMSPWDESGQPMRAKITMTFQVSGETSAPQRNAYSFVSS